MKKILILSFVIVLLSPTFSYAQTSQDPEIVSLSVSKTTVTAGDSIDVRAVIRNITSSITVNGSFQDEEGKYKNMWFDLVRESQNSENWIGTINTNRWMKGGVWKLLYISIRDWEMQFQKQYSFIDFPVSFFVNQVDPDITPPSIQNIRFSPSMITAGEKVNVFVNTSDDKSGVRYIQMSIISPTGVHGTSIESLQQNSTDPSIWTGEILVPQYVEGGKWAVEVVSISDFAGNYFGTEIETPPFFTVQSNNSDTVPPVIGNISVNPQRVRPGETVRISVQLSDNLSGVRFAAIELRGAQFLGYLWPFREKHGRYYQLRSNDSLRGEWFVDVPIDKDFSIGKWRVKTVWATDALGNYVYKRYSLPKYFTVGPKQGQKKLRLFGSKETSATLYESIQSQLMELQEKFQRILSQ